MNRVLARETRARGEHFLVLILNIENCIPKPTVQSFRCDE